MNVKLLIFVVFGITAILAKVCDLIEGAEG